MSINCKQLRELIIRPTLQNIGFYSDADENILLGTCAQESQLGTYIKQIGGVALGIYQIEPRTHRDIVDNYLKFRSSLFDKIKLLGTVHDSSLIFNLAYSTAIARIQYLRAPEAMPAGNDLPGLAAYWKKYYNTPLGKGTEQEFINNYKRYVS